MPAQQPSLPAEIHSSVHQIKFDNTLIGEYEVRIYRGTWGPVVVFRETTSSALPLEYLSESGVNRFSSQVPNAMARFFELHLVAGKAIFVEVGYEDEIFFRRYCPVSSVLDALAKDDESADISVGVELERGETGLPGKMPRPFTAERRHQQ